jgi:hypothetical protein
VFDRSASDAEHQKRILFATNRGISGLFPAKKQLFDTIKTNAAPTVM